LKGQGKTPTSNELSRGKTKVTGTARGRGKNAYGSGEKGTERGTQKQEQVKVGVVMPSSA